MAQKTIQQSATKDLILADILTVGKWVLNLIFFVVLIVLVLEMKSMLQIDIFPNYNFPVDEMVKDFF